MTFVSSLKDFQRLILTQFSSAHGKEGGLPPLSPCHAKMAMQFKQLIQG